MARAEDLGHSPISEKILGGNNIILDVVAPAGTYEKGEIIPATLIAINTTEMRPAVSLEDKTLQVEGKISAVVFGKVQKSGLINATNENQSILFANGIFVEGE